MKSFSLSVVLLAFIPFFTTAFRKDYPYETVKQLDILGRVLYPTITFPCSEMPHVCANMENAIQNGAPSQLYYLKNATQTAINRRASGCPKLQREHGNSTTSCDEYPFASTQQGGAGAFIRLVPRVENSRQGGYLSQFYRQNIPNGGYFNVDFN
ncbi:uncharacterized protein LOC114529590 [Dendronephthya gigantea]|uniref:uncharacterized protein LOC114529590 n=1 Tax=Dendronephthya gigantea TaxID=151771 RepID=UPI00106A6B61|nr:uncharacterized protein LOC114529590 [Dendronephthya gigantea]